MNPDETIAESSFNYAHTYVVVVVALSSFSLRRGGMEIDVVCLARDDGGARLKPRGALQQFICHRDRIASDRNGRWRHVDARADLMRSRAHSDDVSDRTEVSPPYVSSFYRRGRKENPNAYAIAAHDSPTILWPILRLD